MFSQMFGGQAFHDWVGEIALGKQLQQAMDISMTEEEKEELKRELAKEEGADLSSIPATSAPAQPGLLHPADAEKPAADQPSPSAGTGTSTPTTPAASGSEIHKPGTSTPTSAAKPGKMTAEQRAQLHALEVQRQKETQERIRTLAQKLKDRCRAFENATNPGEASGGPAFRLRFT